MTQGWKGISASDVEKATKAAQSAAFLCNDLTQLVRSNNALLSDLALAALGHDLIVAFERVNELHICLERLQQNLEALAD